MMKISRDFFLRLGTWLLIIFFLDVPISQAAATETPLYDLSLDELMDVAIVSATQRQEKVKDLPASVTVIQRDAIAFRGAQNLAEVLRETSAVLVRKAPGNFPAYTVAIRGNTADFMNNRTLILIDGVQAFNPNSGFDPSWIPVSIIERIEIVKGPVSALYGANAFGGVINVITRSGAEFKNHNFDVREQLQVENDPVGNNRQLIHAPAVSAGNSGQAWTYFFAGESVKGPSNRSYSGFSNLDAFGKATYKASDRLQFTLSSLVSDDKSQIANTNVFDPIENLFIQAVALAKYEVNSTTGVELRFFVNDFSHTLKYTDALVDYKNDANTYGASAQVSVEPIEHHQLRIGLGFGRDRGFLSTKGYDYTVVPPVANSAGWTERTQRTYSAYLQHQYTGWERFRPLLGVRFDHNSQYGDSFSPRAGLSYKASDIFSVYGAFGRAFRAPVFNESYINGFGKIGNPNLRPEIGSTFELGVKAALNKWDNGLTVFREGVRDKVELVTSGGSSTYVNMRNTHIYGVEFEGAVAVGERLRPFYSATFLDTDNGTGRRIDSAAHRKVVVGTHYRLGSWDLRYSLIHDGPVHVPNTSTTVVSDADGRVQVPAFTTMNIEGATSVTKFLRLMLFANNFTNHKHKEMYSSYVLDAGLWDPGLSAGLRLQAKF